MSHKLRTASTINQDTPRITLSSNIADPSAKHFARNSTRHPTASRLNPLGPCITITETPDLHQHIDTILCPPVMTKLFTGSPQVPETTPKKPRAMKKSKTAKKTAHIEDAPSDANDQPSASETSACNEREVTSTIEGNEVTPHVSDEDASIPKKKDAEASTPKKAKAKGSIIDKKNAKAADPKKDNTELSAPKVPKIKGSKRPVGDGFFPYQHSIIKPASNPFWGIRPVPGDPRPHPDQPSARASNGQTNPPLFENRGYRYKRGARYVRHHYTIDPLNNEHLPRNRDQEDLLAVPLIDMRPKKVDGVVVPKRGPDVYCYDRTPRDWNCKQSIKALNDRRYQAIDCETMDGPWTVREQDYLARLIRQNPDASIWELTELHNDRFMGKDFKENIGFAVQPLSTGRTVESVRYQYTAYKPFYDRGRVPEVRWRGDKSAEGIALATWIVQEKKFGRPSKAEQLAHDRAQGGHEDSDDDDNDIPKKQSSKGKKSKALPNSDDENGDESDANDAPPGGKRHASEQPEDDERPIKYSRTGNRQPFPGQPRLSDDDEDLLELAINWDDDDVEEVEEVTEAHNNDAQTHVDPDVHATRSVDVDEEYDD